MTAPRRSAHLSQGFEVLAARLAGAVEPRYDFDVVVIGSGYGGAVAAAELAGRVEHGKDQALRVCVLERGREYLPGMFPTGLAELPRHIRYNNETNEPRGERTALWDFRVGSDISVLVANGLGGGSLINAGVMEEPSKEVLRSACWPAEIRSDADLGKWFRRARERLGAADDTGRRNTWSDVSLPKVVAFDRLGAHNTKRVALTIATEQKLSRGNVQLEACIRCGDCATGCNFSAKESLDTNLLVSAQRAGAEIYSGATVLRLEKLTPTGGWIIVATHTDHKLRRREEQPLRIFSRKVVVAAGTLGSTELLLRSRSARLRFSARLGQRFSGNGDMLASLVGLKSEVDAISDEQKAPNDRQVGPTITSMIDERNAADLNARCVVQELSVPSALRRLFEEVNAIADGFDALDRGDENQHFGTNDDRDPCAIDDASTKCSMTVAIIGHDSADGVIELTGSPEDWSTNQHGDGAIHIRWPESCRDERLSARQARLTQLLQRSKLGGRALANPFWRLLSPELEFLFDAARGPLLTVHPLGGCVMGQDAAKGVVDHLGRVYDSNEGNGVHDGLVVLDGSVMASSLGINPALTITALALRALSQLQDEWQLRELEPALPLARERVHGERNTPQPIHRPIYRNVPRDRPANADPVSTQVELTERMSGPVSDPCSGAPLYAELTLRSKPRDVRKLMSSRPLERRLDFDPDHSRLRLFKADDWEAAQERPDDDLPDERAELIVQIAGTLKLFTHEASTAQERRWRALLPWLRNRGLRDMWQDFADRFMQPRLERLRLSWTSSPRLPQEFERRGFIERVKAISSELHGRARSTVCLLSLAGEVRLFEYDLTVGETLAPSSGRTRLSKGSRIRAIKRLTYEHRANPWNQLLEATLVEAPLAPPTKCGPAKLTLDLRFLERRATPLFRLLDQEDQVTALVDVVSFLLYTLRIVLRVHTWSFRKPDVLPAKPIDRFPRLDGATAEIFEIDTTGPRAEVTKPRSKIRLTRFPPIVRGSGGGQPVLMIHGYSVSGTTFAHPAAPSLARTLAEAGYDAWVVDLRTSAALETARLPWSFEEVAYADIPKALDHIVSHTGFTKVDIVAHCMGSAMICMALLDTDRGQQGLDPYRDGTRIDDPFPELRRELQTRVRRLVMSQVTPVTLFTPNNLFRAFVLRYVRHYLNLENYTFRVEGTPSISDQLLDRLLATLPYPVEEFDRENPPPWRLFKRTPWTSTRHRMDALYGRDFSLKNLSEETLEYIDDFFGPLNINTVSQGMHFARSRVLTDRTGYNRYVTLTRLQERLPFPVLSLHGSENGLVDAATAVYLKDRWAAARVQEESHLTVLTPNHGHQDSFIGVHAKKAVFDEILSFLGREDF